MKNPWGLEGKNPWKKDKKEPSLEKKSNPWGLSGNKPWGKEETDKERIARLEKEVEDLKNDKKPEHDDSWIDEQGFVPKPKKKKSGIGCLSLIIIIIAGIYVINEFNQGSKKDKEIKTEATKSYVKEKRDLETKYTIGDVYEARWTSDLDVFYVYMKKPNDDLTFKKSICKIAKNDFGIKDNFNIQIGLKRDYTKVGSQFLCSSASIKSEINKTSSSNSKGQIGDEKKYKICYGQMTKVHKRTGMHENNREGSIEAKETICGAYSRGEINDYPKP